MEQSASYLIALLLVAGGIALLLIWLRFGIISQFITRGARSRLRHPNPTGIEALCGFPPPPDLIDLFRDSSFIEMTEFYLSDLSTTPPTYWPIGSFSPLTQIDVREWRTITKVPGIPLADNMNKGEYYLNCSGAVMLASPNFSEHLLVAPSIGTLAKFKPTDEVGDESNVVD